MLRALAGSLFQKFDFFMDGLHKYQPHSRSATLVVARGANLKGTLRCCWNNKRYCACTTRFYTREIISVKIVRSLGTHPQENHSSPLLVRKISTNMGLKGTKLLVCPSRKCHWAVLTTHTWLLFIVDPYKIFLNNVRDGLTKSQHSLVQ